MSSTQVNRLESRIVSLLNQRDKQAIGLIYDNYASALFGVITRIVRTPENAEEVLQDVLLKVWNKSTSYDSSKGRLYTWLLNIARNSSIDYTRSAKFKADQRNTELNTSFHDNAKLSTSENIKDSGLAKVLMGLDEKYRKIIELAYFNQYTQVEIVEELDIPLGTVKSRLRIAIRELRKLLGDEVGLLIILIVVLFLL